MPLDIFYAQMAEGDSRRWWNAEAEAFGTRQAATRYSANERPFVQLATGCRWVGPCDGTEA